MRSADTRRKNRVHNKAAINFAVLNTIGGFLALLGLGMFYSRTGALNMAQIGHTLGRDSSVLVVTAFVFTISGFLIKAAAFPFHFWLADAHAVAPTPVCVLFSGVMVELGVYAVARGYWVIADGLFAAHRPAITAVLLVVGCMSALLGAFMCFAQRHLKRLLAFSTAKASLFLVAGILLHRFVSVDEAQLHAGVAICRGLESFLSWVA
jgi:multicomponent Na+:H+ antiporter subunit D